MKEELLYRFVSEYNKGEEAIKSFIKKHATDIIFKQYDRNLLIMMICYASDEEAYSYSDETFLSLLRLCLDSGADINYQDKEGRSALQFSVLMEQKHVVNFLIEEHAEIDIVDVYGFTPLMRAAFNTNNYEIGCLLVENNADIYRTNSNNGQSALSIMKLNEVKYAIWKELIDKYDPK